MHMDSDIDAVSIAATKKYSSVPLTACLSPLSLDLFHRALKLFIAVSRTVSCKVQVYARKVPLA